MNGTDRVDVERYLLSRGMLAPDAMPIAIARAGAGNMNLALRVTTRDGRSFILKQGRPWVEKYAHIPAPFERTLVEAAFYSAVQSEPGVARRMPSVFHVDADNHVLLLEDIGAAGDFTSIYDDGAVTNATVAALLDWLQQLSRVSVPVDGRAVFSNRAMRALNHEHMFVFPSARSERPRSGRHHGRPRRRGATARDRSGLRSTRSPRWVRAIWPMANGSSTATTFREAG